MPLPNIEPINFIKIPFLWSLYYLKNGLKYEEAIKDIVSRGGDTTNNAAIVGGLLGTFCDTTYLLLL